ncbi:hypothetical protein EIP91_005352 [Steccherinum ochraceum]|uniref:PIG-P domain-containing protein n=1 Tax=Steccherinum ochraceum TaxID=92696 RepID=A0A4R0RA39_9APHY|nr:hypothetical protein EIP91_005352 [Steccherinum ochraceum]
MPPAVSDTVETGPTSPVSPLAPYPALPTEVRSRAPEFYGFVAWSGTYLLFCIFLLWALLPDATIVSLGVSWYPNRPINLRGLAFSYRYLLSAKYRKPIHRNATTHPTNNSDWALLLPAYSIVLVLLTYFTYFALAIAGTPSFSDMRTITDSRAVLPGPDEPNPYLLQARSNAIPELYDIPIGLVNRVVYGRRKRTGIGSMTMTPADVIDTDDSTLPTERPHTPPRSSSPSPTLPHGTMIKAKFCAKVVRLGRKADRVLKIEFDLTTMSKFIRNDVLSTLVAL